MNAAGLVENNLPCIGERDRFWSVPLVYFHNLFLDILPLKLGPIRSETWVTNCQLTHRNVPECRRPPLHRGDSQVSQLGVKLVLYRKLFRRVTTIPL